jgi:hypothetical protein
MRIKDIKEFILNQNNIPKIEKDINNWFNLEDAIIFLLETKLEMIPVYISCKQFFLYSLIVPKYKLRKDYIDDLLKWNFGASNGYSYGYTNHNGKITPKIFPPMDDSGNTEILRNSSPIFFYRSFEGYNNGSFLELNQKIEHILDVYWLEDKKAFCRIDELGDFKEIVTVEKESDLILCTIKKKDLDFYLYLTNSVLIRVFDVIRVLDISKFSNFKDRKEEIYKNENEKLFLKRTKQFNHENKINAAWIRGFQIIKNTTSIKELQKILKGEKDKKYTSFIINDWKNKKICEWSCDPKKLGNYFVESNLPYETSPAFFKPEVLSKYKQDPSKYVLKDRNIVCRGAWSLDYDINEEGQVHAYLIDLSRLPYGEQLYWKSFNKEPKAGISKRALKSDFLGEWDFEYDALFSLKGILEKFPKVNFKGKEFAVWKLREVPDPNLLDNLNYVVTDSKKEWKDQILVLAQILIDGLNKKAINTLAKYLNCSDNELGSIKLLSVCLEKAGISSDDIKIIIDPLPNLWDLRSNVVAHPNKCYPKCNLKNQFKNLLENCDKSMRKLAEIINRGSLNIE